VVAAPSLRLARPLSLATAVWVYNDLHGSPE